MRLIDADEYEKRIRPYDTEDVMDKALYNFAHERLITTPTAQEISKWIPCEESYPSESGYYLVIIHGITIEYFHAFFGDGGKDEWKAKNVIAWTPLPQLYEKE